MLKIDARNDDGVRLHFEFDNPDDFIALQNNDDDCIFDHEILLVELDNKILYSSLGRKTQNGYNDTLRTMEVYDWFCPLASDIYMYMDEEDVEMRSIL